MKTKCQICGEVIPHPAPIQNPDGSFSIICHECNGEKKRLMPEYNKDQAWVHDNAYHGSKNDGEW